MINVDEYQKLALRTAPKNMYRTDQIVNGLLGLNAESGECADVWKKSAYMGHPFEKEKLLREMGDVMWYMAILADGLDVKLSDVLQMNIDKLKARYPDGFDTEKSLHRAEGDI